MPAKAGIRVDSKQPPNLDSRLPGMTRWQGSGSMLKGSEGVDEWPVTTSRNITIFR